MTDNFVFISEADVVKAEAVIGVPKFGPIGWITDYRTYRRWLPKLKRRETFFERNARVVNYNLSLAVGLQDTNELQEEADLMYNYMNNFLTFASGRTMWVGGTKTSEAHPACNFNCSFLAINRVEAFLTLFELLMLGTGVGYRVFESDICNLPRIKQVGNFAVGFQEYIPVSKQERQEETTTKTTYISEEVAEGGPYEVLTISVGDSRDGWIHAVRILLSLYFSGVSVPDYVNFNVNSIRPMGERINGFGGTASGPEALKGIINDIVAIFEQCPEDKLRSIDCMDIADCIAKGVIAGSSRRSALICLFDEGDELCAKAKVNLPDDKQYRWQSNNTECIGSKNVGKLKAFLESNPDSSWDEILDFIDQFKPSKEWFEKRFKVIEESGEPGIYNFLAMSAKRWVAVRKWRPNVAVLEIWNKYCDIGANPCVEIILSAGYSIDPAKLGKGVSFCNLTTHPLQNFVEDGKLNYEKLEKAIRLATRIGLRQTCVTMPRDELNETQAEERLLGVSATGWRKMMDLLGWKTAGEEVKNLQQKMREWANDEATTYSAKLGVPRPLLVTCIKPEGTGSKVFGSSDGLHWEWAPYYIRRIQMSTTDALAKTLKDQGFIWHPTPYDLSNIVEGSDCWEQIKNFEALPQKEKERVFSKSNAVQFSFPIKAEAKVSQGEVSAIEQLENVKSFSVNYTDHTPSSTITVKSDEWGQVADWVYSNWRTYSTAAFLSYWSGNYPLLPYEDISEEEYQQLLSSFDPQYVTATGFKVDESLVNQFELEDIEDGVDIDDVDLGSACSTSGCPIR